MRILKQILAYLFWVLISYICAFGYLLVIFGTRPKSSTFFKKVYDFLFLLALEQIVLIIGLIIALLFILIDVFHLKRKLKNNSKRIIFRFLVIIIITLVVCATHYILEKVVDVI